MGNENGALDRRFENQLRTSTRERRVQSLALTRASSLRACGALMLALVLASLGCSSGSAPAPVTTQPGQIALNLTGVSASGAVYRLRQAFFIANGPDSTIFLDTEESPNLTQLTAAASPGFYTLFLQGGWFLERVDNGVKTPLAAELLSPNPQSFLVVQNALTNVPLRFAVGGEELTGSFGITLEVEERQGPPATLCQSTSECASGQTCCVSGFLGTCLALGPGEPCPLPDLTVSAATAASSVSITSEVFGPGSCALEEGCVDGPGERRLLRFSTETGNIGEADVILGDPNGVPGFEFGQCHGHFHFEAYASYELVDTTGAIAAVGHKQAFCLLDSIPLGLPGAPTTPRFHCGFQGIQRGWSDVYGSGLDCQWVDITSVPNGDYLLRISINPDRVLPESNFDNNVAEVPVRIADPPAPDEPCQFPQAGASRDCDWSFAPGFIGLSCTPGELVTIGCGGCSGVGSCSGDPMVRVCEGTEACRLSTTIGLSDDSCSLCPEAQFICPASGQYSTLLAPFSSGSSFTCELGIVNAPLPSADAGAPQP